MVTESFPSVAQMFRHRVEATPDALAYRFPVGASGWASLTWRETQNRVRRIACGLRKLGIDNEQCCAIQASTRIEWVLADLGIMCSGACTSTIYPSTTVDECHHILTDSGSRVVFAENDEQIEKLLERRDELPEVIKVVTFDGKSGHEGWVMTLDELEQLGDQHDSEDPARYDAVIDSIRPEHLATLIYTSGTTGKPKGVELTHDCWVFEGEAIAGLGTLLEEDHQYLWLPLSHSLGKVLQVGQLHIGLPTTVDGRIPKLVENLPVVQPTFMGAAPRIFEKIYNKVQTSAAEAGGAKLAIFHWACRVGGRVSRLRQQGRSLDLPLRLQYALADRLVFSKLRKKFGGRVRFFISGAAPLARDIAEFFHGAGIVILEGYGLTETSAASFVNRLDSFKFGTVGKPIGSTEVKIAEDGEILIRGRGVMRGYHNMPEETAEVLTEDGWLKTGDIGELDSDGFLTITDRKKDLIKTSGGKYVAPQLIEAKVKTRCPYIGHVVAHGDRRNFCSALITIDKEAITQWAADHQESSFYAELTKSPRIRAMVQEAVDDANSQLASFETVKKFAILPRELTVESGELTPSLKVKRKIVEDNYRHILDAFYV